jgi:predicted molibdopterin-dependent oxidoreductase YjgC
MLGKIGVQGSGLALATSQCNTTGMQIAGFDSVLLPGGIRTTHEAAAKRISNIWSVDLKKLIGASAANLHKKIREDKIRAAFIFGENPSVAPEYHSLVNNLEFLVVADMFMTETAQAADVFLPLSGYLETEGHLTNWCGMLQPIHPIGKPLNGMQTSEILVKLAALAGHTMNYTTVGDISEELNSIVQEKGIAGKLDSEFMTENGKVHFALYGERVMTTPPAVPKVLEIDARMIARSKSIKG